MLEKTRAFLRRLFPPELTAWIPGSKLIAGVILAVLASAFGVGEETVIDMPIVGEISVAALALGVGVYLYPPPKG